MQSSVECDTTLNTVTHFLGTPRELSSMLLRVSFRIILNLICFLLTENKKVNQKWEATRSLGEDEKAEAMEALKRSSKSQSRLKPQKSFQKSGKKGLKKGRSQKKAEKPW
jgi:hypothetical protein